MRILFICAHPDDLELCVGEFIYRLNKLHQVDIVSVSRGEWGCLDKKLKGRWLGKIRERELKEASKVHGINPENVKFLDYIDGQIYLDKTLINDLYKLIKENNYKAVFAPEYLYTYYFHPDHINLGKAILIVIKRMDIKLRPKLFFYHTIYPNKFLKINFKRTQKAIMKHRTQILIIGYFIALRPVIDLFYGIISKKLLFSEGVRKVYLNKEKKLELPLFLKLIYYGLSIGKIFQKAWKKND